MRVIQFREALGEAMAEEMRADASIFLMGEEVAEYNGAYKVSQGMLEEFGSKRVIVFISSDTNDKLTKKNGYIFRKDDSCQSDKISKYLKIQ